MKRTDKILPKTENRDLELADLINLPISDESRKQAQKFVDEYILRGYGQDVLNVGPEEFHEFIYKGKLGELVFRDLLMRKKIPHECKDILKPHPGKFKREGSDFVLTDTKETLDVKVSPKSFHIRLLVREDQFRQKRHDLYVGIKYVDENVMECWGYTTGQKLAEIKPKSFGRGPCRHILLEDLIPIRQFIHLARAGKVISKERKVRTLRANEF